ncbi:MAG: hypothetical protein HOC77_09250 [Chloroflexi bacterium]|mgnify:CR=1|jgi:hypothetical protein|nr:hypothetical protein [Chloroflexota bacterium]MBT4072677.1 hypothetical protein [Chloroflexota bacterium]MBT4515258.1 hypothetical protein [Chloroflexota bacterium]MBT5320489.1 hypothetical protein [Chloroflexota bacterium]MBT6682653.1 hypothetical protein [Chloroflexota bacterium]
MKNADRKSSSETVLACRTLPLPLFALYGLGAAGITWMIAAWRDRRQRSRLREEIRVRRSDEDDDGSTEL